jgi:hypothetical protein
MDLVELAEDLKQRGMFLATAAQEFVSPLWSERAFNAIVRLARVNATVHVDDVLRFFHEKPSHPNAWGAVYSRAIREHVIQHSGRVKACTSDPTKHKHLSPIYTSLIYRRMT